MKFGTNYEKLAHHWVYNNDYSDCYGYRMYSENNMLYSYGSHYLLAQKIKINDEQVFIINDYSNSNTTNKQRNCVIRAIPRYSNIFYLPDAKLDHEVNVKYFCSLVEEFAIKESKAKSVDYKPDIRRNINDLKRYIDLFKLDKRRLTKSQKYLLKFDYVIDDIQDLVQLLTGIRNERVRIQKRKQAKINKDRRDKEQLTLKLWLDNEISHHYFQYLDKTYLRLSKDNTRIETTTSAHIKVEDALLLHAKVKRAEKLLGSKVGNFKIVEATKVFRIGCTELTRDTLNDMCKQLHLEEVF